VALIASLVTFVLSVPLATGFRAGARGFSFEQRTDWAPNLGFSYHVGLDGVSLLLVLPVVTLLLVSFAREGNWTTQTFPTVYTVANYVTIFSDPRAREVFLNSLSMSAIAAAAVRDRDAALYPVAMGLA